MNNYALSFNISIVEFCINHKKWRWYLLYLNMVKNIRTLVKKSKRKILIEDEYNGLLNDIDESLQRINIKNKCLVRSSIAMIYLSGYMNKFTMNIGVILNPFRAHSWISLNEIPICESEDASVYITLMRL